ncbi:MAG: hypothetical protein MST12_01110, partial [Spirochaetia bacterium]|nr:hypothetical protein [Spirochaetia bacterium]
EEIRSAAAEFSTAFAATQLFLNLSFFPPLRILSHLNFFKQWVMSIFFKFFVVNSYNTHYCCSLGAAPSTALRDPDYLRSEGPGGSDCFLGCYDTRLMGCLLWIECFFCGSVCSG